MTINKAIQKAQENGLKPREITLGESWIAQVLLMPEFWKALAKSMGCSEDYTKPCPICDDCISDVGVSISLPEWLYHWHRFIDHLAEGKDIESFFEQLKFKE